MDNSLRNSIDTEQILETAEAVVRCSITATPVPDLDPCPVSGVEGVFVTIRIDEALRGCIGYLQLEGSFTDTLCDAARKAATTDFRFPPIEEDELDGMTVDVTLLGKAEPVSDPLDFVIGRHGLILEAGSKRGLLLPQVPVEHRWDKEEFLDALCKKAMAPPDTWRSPAAQLSRFEGLVLKRDSDITTSRNDGGAR